jgi:hypothetical protein
MGSLIKGPWNNSPEADNVPEVAEEASFLPEIFEWVEKGNIFEAFKTPEEAFENLLEEFRAGDVEFSEFELAQIFKILQRYYFKHQQLETWREPIKTEEGHSKFIDIIGRGLIDPDSVTLDLDHPVFIGVIFKEEHEARAYRKKTSERIDDVGGWGTLSNYTSDPVLDLTCYFGVEGQREQDKQHEIQHLLFGNVYNPRLRSFPIGQRPLLDRFDSREDIENNLFLNELLAYMKANEWPLKTYNIFNEFLEGGFPELPFEDVMILKRKYRFLKEVIAKGIEEKQLQPRDLWKHAQAANSLDDALRNLFEQIYTPDERESLYQSEEIGETQQQNNARFRALLSEFQFDEELEDPIVLYEKSIGNFSPKWRKAFKAKPEQAGWTPEQRYQYLSVDRNKVAGKISKHIRFMREMKPIEANEWIEEMIENYPFFDERVKVLEKLSFDLWALNIVEGLEEIDLSIVYRDGHSQEWLKYLNEHRLRLMRKTHDYLPFQERRQELLARVAKIIRELESIIGNQGGGRKTNP